MPENINNYSKAGQRLIGGGVGLILAWAGVTFLPKTLTPWAVTETGKIVLFYAQIGLFVGALGAIVVVCSMIATNIKAMKIKSIKIKGVEINFDNKEDSEEGGESDE